MLIFALCDVTNDADTKSNETLRFSLVIETKHKPNKIILLKASKRKTVKITLERITQQIEKASGWISRKL